MQFKTQLKHISDIFPSKIKGHENFYSFYVLEEQNMWVYAINISYPFFLCHHPDIDFEILFWLIQKTYLFSLQIGYTEINCTCTTSKSAANDQHISKIRR